MFVKENQDRKKNNNDIFILVLYTVYVTRMTELQYFFNHDSNALVDFDETFPWSTKYFLTHFEIKFNVIHNSH